MKKRICIIGPFPPIKGGISQYNGFLADEFKKKSEVCCISYKRQYPDFLVKHVEQTDKNHTRNSDVNFCIDSVNPYTWILTLYRIRKFRPDLVILPWWVVYWIPMYMFFLISFKIEGIRSLLICHNVYEHEDNIIKHFFSRMTLRTADMYLVHSASEKDKLSSFTSKHNIIRHLLPAYGSGDTSGASPEKSGTLKLLFFGFVREYKGLDLLLESFTLLNDQKISLTVAGEFWSGKDACLKFIKKYNLRNISILDGYLRDEEVKKYFLCADVVILPYRHATGSAVISLAYSYRKPVIVTNVGGLPDAVLNRKTGYIVEPTPSDIALGIKWFIKNKKRNFADAIEKFVQTSMSWRSLVEDIYIAMENR